MNFDNLRNEIIKSAKLSFSDLIATHPGENFYSFILYTDEDCYTVLPSANSEKAFLEKIAKRGVSDPKKAAGYKWSIGEWAYEAWMGDAFDDICESLANASSDAAENGDFEQFRASTHKAMIDALKVIDAEGFFGDMRKDMVLFISSSDYYEAMKLKDMSAKALNSADTYDRFTRRFEGAL